MTISPIVVGRYSFEGHYPYSSIFLQVTVGMEGFETDWRIDPPTLYALVVFLRGHHVRYYDEAESIEETPEMLSMLFRSQFVQRGSQKRGVQESPGPICLAQVEESSALLKVPGSGDAGGVVPGLNITHLLLGHFETFDGTVLH